PSPVLEHGAEPATAGPSTPEGELHGIYAAGGHTPEHPLVQVLGTGPPGIGATDPRACPVGELPREPPAVAGDRRLPRRAVRSRQGPAPQGGQLAGRPRAGAG